MSARERYLQRFAAVMQVKRGMQGWSQEELSRRSGLPLSSIQVWESMQGVPLLADALVLADVFKCSLDELVGRAPEQKAWHGFVLRRERDSLLVPITHSGFKIGRETAACDFSMPDDDSVSRVHTVFDIDDGQLTAADNVSLNGTYVNGAAIPVSEQYALRAGDRIEIGQSIFEVQCLSPTGGNACR